MAELNKNQKITGKNGGARPGAGRPKGSTNKLKVIDFFSIEEREELVNQVKQMVLFSDKPDRDMAKFLWEQIFGKSTQRSEITGADGESLRIVFDQVFNKNNDK